MRERAGPVLDEARLLEKVFDFHEQDRESAKVVISRDLASGRFVSRTVMHRRNRKSSQQLTAPPPPVRLSNRNLEKHETEATG